MSVLSNSRLYDSNLAFSYLPVTDLADTSWTLELDNTTFADTVASYLSDDQLTYDETLALLFSVVADGITANEYNDLKTFYTQSYDFFSSDYLRTITYNTIFSNPSNEFYWGGAKSLNDVITLGDLAPGDSEQKGLYLIEKWFLGKDLPMPIVGGDTANNQASSGTFNYSTGDGELFVDGASPNDIYQGYAGTCYLLAAFGSIAAVNPQYLYDAVTYNGNGTFGVRFFFNGETYYTTVDMSVPVNNYNQAIFASSNFYHQLTGEQWVSLFEKAYAQINTQFPVDGRYNTWFGENSYQVIEGGWADPIQQITNLEFTYYSSYYWFNNDTKIDSNFLTYKQTIIDALTNGSIGWIATWSNTYSPQGIRQFVAGHAFIVVGYNADTDTFTIRNPWGETDSNNFDTEFDVKLEDHWLSTYMVIGLTTESADNLQQSFTYNYEHSLEPVTEGSKFTLTIKRSGTGQKSTLYLETNADTADNSDFKAISKTAITFSEFETTKTITIDTLSDTLTEGNESFSIDIYKASTDIDPLHTITVDIADYVAPTYNYTVSNAHESSETALGEGKTVSFLITRDTSGTPSTVYISTENGTTSFNDIAGVTKKAITFAANELTKSVQVLTLVDELDEDNENFTLHLFKNPGDEQPTISSTAWVKDAIAPSIEYSLTNNSSSENSALKEGDSISFTLTRSVTGISSNVWVAIDFGSAGNSDIQLDSKTYTFAPNQKEIIINVPIVKDLWLETNEYFTLEVFGSEADETPIALSRAYIKDKPYEDFNYTISNTSSEAAPLSEGSPITFTITRSGTGSKSTVYVQTSNVSTSDSDIVASELTAITFEAYQDTKTFVVDTLTDNTAEDVEAFALELYRNYSDTDAAALSIAYLQDTTTSDFTYTVTRNSNATEFLEGTSIEFVITRNGTGESSTIYYSTVESTATSDDLVMVRNQSLTFAPHETSKIVTITTNQDDIVENSELFWLNVYLTEVDAQTLNWHEYSYAYIADNQQSNGEFSYNIASNGITTEGGAVTFTITRNGTGESSSVFYSTSHGDTSDDDYKGVGLTKLTFAAFETEKTVTVETFKDDKTEGIEYFWLDLFANQAAADNFDYLAYSYAEIQDADSNNEATQLFNYSISNTTANGSTSEGGDLTFVITRDASGSESSIFIGTVNSNASNSDYQAFGITEVIFESYETEKTITISTYTDNITENDEYFWLNVYETYSDALSSNWLTYATGLIKDQSSNADYSYTLSSTSSASNPAIEGTSTELVVTRSGSGEASTIYLSTWSDTANYGVDIEALDIKAVNFAAHETVKTITLDVYSDDLSEGVERLWVVQSDSYDEAYNYVYSAYTSIYIGDPEKSSSYTYNITNNSSEVTPVLEGNDIVFTITRTGTDLSNASVMYVDLWNGNTSYVDLDDLGITEVTFAPYETEKTIIIETYTDDLSEGSEYLWLVGFTNLQQANTGDYKYYSTAYINDSNVTMGNYQYSATTNSPNGEINEGGDIIFTISRDISEGAATIFVSTSDGSADKSDYNVLELTEVTFADGQSTANVIVSTYTDSNYNESPEYFWLDVYTSKANAISGNYVTYASAFIGNGSSNPASNITYTVTSQGDVSEGENAIFRISRDNSESAATVFVSTIDGTTNSSDFTSLNAFEVDFAAGVDFVDVSIATTLDSRTENPEFFWFDVYTSYADALNSNYAAYDSVFIYDNEQTVTQDTYAVTSNTSNSVGMAATEGDDIIFTITRNDTSSAATIYVNTVDGNTTQDTDYNALGITEVSFAAGEESATVNVSTLTDTVTEGMEYFFFNVYHDYDSAVSNSWAAYTAGFIDDHSETSPLYTYTISSDADTEETAVIEGQSVNFTITRSGSGSASTMYVRTVTGTNSADFNDFEEVYYEVIFGELDTEVVIAVDTFADDLSEGVENFFMTTHDNLQQAETGYYVSYAIAFINDYTAPAASATTDQLDLDTSLITGSTSHPGHNGSNYSNKYAFAAVTRDGNVISWGEDSAGADLSSVASQLSEITAIASSHEAFAAITWSGEVVTWGNPTAGGDSSQVASRIDGSNDVISIASSHSAFAALHEDGAVTVWGNNATGGDESLNSVLNDGVATTQIFSNSSAFSALRQDGSVKTWGYGLFGGDSSQVSSLLDGTIDVIEISATQSSFAALRIDGSVITWGNANAGGNASAISSELNGNMPVVRLFATTMSFAALRGDGSVVTWGDASAGGNSLSVASSLDGTIDVVGIYSTNNAFAALREDGSVITWGNPEFGSSNSINETLDGTNKVVSIVSNQAAFAAIMQDGSVVTWGQSAFGGDASFVADALDGTVDVVSISASSNGFAAIRSDGSVVAWGAGLLDSEMSAIMERYDGTSPVTSIIASDNAFAVLDAQGNVDSFGNAFFGGSTASVSNTLVDILGINPTESLDITLSGINIAGQIYHWQNHSLLSSADITISDSSDALIANGNTTTNGQFSFINIKSQGSLQLSASLNNQTTDAKAITSADALAALKVAVGINPNANGDAVSPYQLLAADVNKDGRVTSADALEILKMAVKLPTATTPEWLLVNEAETFWNGNSLTIDKSNITYSGSDISIDSDMSNANFVGVLLGDVNGSWQNSDTNAEILPSTYFDDLAIRLNMPVDQWWIA